MTYSTTIHGPAADAPAVTNKVASCKVCGSQWQVRSFASPPTDAQGCPLCHADDSAITISQEDERA